MAGMWPAFRATLSQSGLTFPFLCLWNEPPGHAFWIWCWAVGGGSIWHHYLAQSMGWSISNWQGSGVIKLGILIRGGGGALGTVQPLTPALVSSMVLLTLQAHLSGGVWGLRSVLARAECVFMSLPCLWKTYWGQRDAGAIVVL